MEYNFTALPTGCPCGSGEFTARAYIPVDLDVGLNAATWRLGTDDPLRCVVEAVCKGCGVGSRSDLGTAGGAERGSKPEEEENQKATSDELAHNANDGDGDDANDGDEGKRSVLAHTTGLTRLLLRDLLPSFGALTMTRPWYTSTRMWRVERS